MQGDHTLDTLRQARDAALKERHQAHLIMQDKRNAFHTSREYLSTLRAEQEITRAPYLKAKKIHQQAEANRRNGFIELSTVRKRMYHLSGLLQQTPHNVDDVESYKSAIQAYRQQAAILTAQLESLRAELKEALALLIAAKHNYQATCRALSQAEREFTKARAEYEIQCTISRTVKEAYLLAKDAYDQAVESLKADKRTIAVLAGVPEEYLDTFYIKMTPDGTVHVYFGDKDRSVPERGHYIIDCEGNVIYRRNPFSPPGSHNYVRPK